MISDGMTTGERGPGGERLVQEQLAAAWAVEETTARVQRKLGRLRTLMHRLDPARLGVSVGQFEALLLSYDVYVRMLADALAETADDLRALTGAPAGEAVPALEGRAS